MKTATLADIVLSAQAAANKAFAPNTDGTSKDILAQRTIKLEEFAASGLDRADFPTWENSFNSQLDTLTVFSKQDSPATVAAKRQAAAGQ